ncbi:Poly(3-hydroxyalkanoate) polymerase subunit PhaC [Alphaproteobacteria bacterium SO-S41]|nr:Poly(3-hydroxyalkanoate) polymerase subunit PhaC [Alphaproteobacteria bacterium SO-S41]
MKIDETKLGDKGPDSNMALNPIVGINPEELWRAAGLVLTEIIRQPTLFAKHGGSFLKDAADVVTGKSKLAAEPKDKRFQHEVWGKSPVFKRGMQGWLAFRKNLKEWLGDLELDDQDRTRANFILDIFADAVAPTNTLIGNPLALKTAWDTKGQSLVKGLKNFVGDIRHNGGLPSQVDKRPFKVGENLATTEGNVVFRTEMMELIQYKPLTAEVHETPLLIIPPQINKYYASDLTPDRSMFRYLLTQGQQLFAISWRNPGKEHAGWGLEAYVKEIIKAIDAVLAITKTKSLNVSGACSGGITQAMLLSYLAAKKDKRVNAATFMVCVLDARPEDSDVGAFISPRSIKLAKARSKQKGILTGQDLSRTFAWLRPNDLIWNYVVNNYLLGNSPPPFDILYWNNDSTNLPMQLHHDYLDFYESEPMRKPGTVPFMGHKIDLGKIQQDVFFLAGVTDHITPWKAVYRSMKLLGSKDKTFILSSSGHIQSLINPPGNPKARFFTNPALPDDVEQFPNGASQTAASWWETWSQWLAERSGAKKPAPKKLGDAKHKPLDKAPGLYVHD